MSIPGAGLVAAAHQGVVALRNRLYDSGRLKVRSLPRPVISVGNLTLGGTGKTPLVESLARLLADEGYLVCILSRGHAGVRRTEPLLVSDLRRLHAGPSVAGDEPYLLGNHLLPAGTLREPRTALRRAHAIGLTRLHQCDGSAARALQEEIQKIAPGVPLFGTRARITGLRRVGARGIQPVSAVSGRKVLAFAGIGRPDSFFADLESLGARIVARRAFQDHHPYTRFDMARLLEVASSSGAEMLVTTEKDAVRLPPPPGNAPAFLALRQSVEAEDPAALLRFIVSKLPGTK